MATNFEIFTYLATKENGGYDAMRRIFTAPFSWSRDPTLPVEKDYPKSRAPAR